jgi:hypothetical protein
MRGVTREILLFSDNNACVKGKYKIIMLQALERLYIVLQHCLLELPFNMHNFRKSVIHSPSFPIFVH